jgi:hypothetical protein
MPRVAGGPRHYGRVSWTTPRLFSPTIMLSRHDGGASRIMLRSRSHIPTRCCKEWITFGST